MKHLLARVAAPASITVRVLLGTLLLTLVLVAAAFIGLSTFDSAMLVAMLINVVVVVGLGTFMGNAGIVSFGHAAFMAIAAYVSGLVSMDPVSRSAVMPTFPHQLDGFSLPFGAGIVLALVLVAVFGALSGSAIVRLRADSAAIATLGVLVIVNVVLLNARSLTNGAQPLYGVSLRTTWQWAFVAAVVAIAISRWYRESNLGLQLRASREDEIAAQALGVNVRARRLEAWILSAVLAGLGGVLLGHFLGAFSPSQFYLTYTVMIVAMLIVGGGGTVTGAVLGTLVVTAVVEGLAKVEPGIDFGLFRLPQMLGLPTIALGVIIVVVMYFRREGLFGRREIDQIVFRGDPGLQPIDGEPRGDRESDEPSLDPAPQTIGDRSAD